MSDLMASLMDQHYQNGQDRFDSIERKFVGKDFIKKGSNCLTWYHVKKFDGRYLSGIRVHCLDDEFSVPFRVRYDIFERDWVLFNSFDKNAGK